MAQPGVAQHDKAQPASDQRHGDKKPDEILWREPQAKRADQLHIAAAHLPRRENGRENGKAQGSQQQPDDNVGP